MPKLRITDETMRAIRGEAIHEFRQTGERQPDGTWLVEFEAGTAARLAAVALPGETLDGTIQRIIRLRRGERPN